MRRALEIISTQPWLITDEGLELVIEVAGRAGDAEKWEALSTRRGRHLSQTNDVTVRDATAIIPVTGPIFRYANLFTEISGATSTQVLATDIQTALDDPSILAIVLDINSPGGTAAGINELGNMIFEARGRKPIVAYGGGTVASAAYWLGSSADEIVIDSTALVGSIGAIMSVLDTSGRDAKAGVRTIEIVSSQSPDKRMDLTNDEGRAKVQKIVDDLAGVFVEAVARNRSIEVDAVLANYGRGGLMVGRAAVEAGLADRIGSLESVLSELSAAREPHRRSFIMALAKPAASANGRGPITISTTAELHAALVAGHGPEEISVATVDVEALKASAKAEGIAEGEAKLTAATTKAADEAVKTERARIAGLQAIAVKGFEKDIQAAIESGATVEATAVAQAKAIKERGTTVAAIASDSPEAVRHGGSGQVDLGAKKPWSKITSRVNTKLARKKA